MLRDAIDRWAALCRIFGMMDFCLIEVGLPMVGRMGRWRTAASGFGNWCGAARRTHGAWRSCHGRRWWVLDGRLDRALAMGWMLNGVEMGSAQLVRSLLLDGGDGMGCCRKRILAMVGWNADGVLDWAMSCSLPSDLDLEGKSSFCNSLWRMDHLGMLLDGGEMEMGGGLDGWSLACGVGRGERRTGRTGGSIWGRWPSLSRRRRVAWPLAAAGEGGSCCRRRLPSDLLLERDDGKMGLIMAVEAWLDGDNELIVCSLMEAGWSGMAPDGQQWLPSQSKMVEHRFRCSDGDTPLLVERPERLYTCIPASPLDSSGIITILERPSPHVSPIASLMTRQVIHLIPDVTLDNIRIDTLLEKPSPHVSPIASLLIRQVRHPIPGVKLDDIRINTILEIS
ncbi:hypothetical protein ACLOJK_008083 [Asimina triloba]